LKDETTGDGSSAFCLRLSAFILACSLAAFGCAGGSQPPTPPAREAEHSVPFRELRCGEVVRKIDSGELAADGSGVVNLPGEMTQLSVGGKAYVTERAGGNRFVLFVISQRGKSFEASIHVLRPLADSDVESLPGGRHVIRGVVGPAGPTDVDLRQELRSDWALVSRRSD
jgi:hypothetical protein